MRSDFFQVQRRRSWVQWLGAYKTGSPIRLRSLDFAQKLKY